MNVIRFQKSGTNWIRKTKKKKKMLYKTKTRRRVFDALSFYNTFEFM